MAEKEEKKQQEARQDAKQEAKQELPSAGGGMGIFLWVLILAIVVAGTMGGFALSQLWGGPGGNQTEATKASGADAQQEAALDKFLTQNKDAGKTWLYDKIEPVVANLDEPGVTRYIRVTVTLEMSALMDETKGTAFLEEKQSLLRDWMTTYFAGLSLEDVRGSRNLTRLKNEVLGYFNELLFGQEKGYVQRVLFKEFAVQ